MLIAITSEGFDLNSNVAEKFTRAPYIIFYNLAENYFEALHNPYSSLIWWCRDSNGSINY